MGYPSVELLGFYIDSLGLSTTAKRMEAFSKLEFPGTLKALETYLRVAGFLQTMILYFAKILEPLQLRKTALLAARQAASKTNTPGKRQAYTRSTVITKPTPIELKSFKELQAAICQGLCVFYYNPNKRLFLQINGSLERRFGVMLYHVKEEYT